MPARRARPHDAAACTPRDPPLSSLVADLVREGLVEPEDLSKALAEAIETGEQALAGTSEANPRRAAHESNLATALGLAVRRGAAAPARLTDVLRPATAAADRTPASHPDRAVYLTNLMLALEEAVKAHVLTGREAADRAMTVITDFRHLVLYTVSSPVQREAVLRTCEGLVATATPLVTAGAGAAEGIRVAVGVRNLAVGADRIPDLPADRAVAEHLLPSASGPGAVVRARTRDDALTALAEAPSAVLGGHARHSLRHGAGLDLDDGPVTAEHLWRLPVRERDVAFVTGCSSAQVAGTLADGVVGLPSALLRAGFRGVFATLWPVSDATTFITLAHLLQLRRDRPDLAPHLLLHEVRRTLRTLTTRELRFWCAELASRLPVPPDTTARLEAFLAPYGGGATPLADPRTGRRSPTWAADGAAAEARARGATQGHQRERWRRTGQRHRRHR
ncbi:CHAT domain-containing protein [Streptomyces sp. NPDC090021]|uniref:CHAT domain-containing protein n=1 Tax=Streptomyces sp. NPDC090021 TaxID=3365919 RepID=UPI0037F8E68B